MAYGRHYNDFSRDSFVEALIEVADGDNEKAHKILTASGAFLTSNEYDDVLDRFWSTWYDTTGGIQ